LYRYPFLTPKVLPRAGRALVWCLMHRLRSLISAELLLLVRKASGMNQVQEIPENTSARTRLLFGEDYYPKVSVADFAPNTRVLDVGCGNGRFLSELQARGITAVGVEIDKQRAESCRSRGFDAHCAKAEELPFPDASFDGVLCNSVLPYTEEIRTIQEWNRVLRPGGEVRATYHGIGFALWVTRNGPGVRRRLFGMKMIVQTLLYWATGKSFFGNRSLVQTTSHMRRYYRTTGFTLLDLDEGKRFLGFPVCIYHHLRKDGEIVDRGS
jgi:SAM-dependent methyltransferase